MIRTVPIPTHVSRIAGRRGLGAAPLIQAGAGGSAGTYTFDSTGLSNDPRLAYYLQDLTPQQLQTALDGGDPGPVLQQLLQDDMNGVGLPCGTTASGDPNCTGGAPLSAYSGLGILSSVPTWVWLAGAGGIGALVLLGRR
jgi:hypothetical protein